MDITAAADPHFRREYLEERLIAVATVRPDLAPEMQERVIRDRLSPAAAGLLASIVREPSTAWEYLTYLAESAAEYDLALRAAALPLSGITALSVGTLVELVQQLPVVGAQWRQAA